MLQDLGEVIEVRNNLQEDIERIYNNREEIIWDKYNLQKEIEFNIKPCYPIARWTDLNGETWTEVKDFYLLIFYGDINYPSPVISYRLGGYDWINFSNTTDSFYTWSQTSFGSGNNFHIPTTCRNQYLKVIYVPQGQKVSLKANCGFTNDETYQNYGTVGINRIALCHPQEWAQYPRMGIYTFAGNGRPQRWELYSEPVIVSGNILSLIYGDNFKEYNEILPEDEYKFTNWRMDNNSFRSFRPSLNFVLTGHYEEYNYTSNDELHTSRSLWEDTKWLWTPYGKLNYTD